MTMRCCSSAAALLVIACACALSAASQESTAARVGVVELVNPGPCNPSLPSWCPAARPASWAASDIETVRRLLHGLADDPVVARVLDRLVTHQFARVFRFERGFDVDATPERPSVNHLWTDRSDTPLRGIHVADGFFTASYESDPIGGFDVKGLELLHEIFHALDAIDGHSARPAFQRLYGRYVTGRVNTVLCDAMKGQVIAYWTRGEYNRGYQVGRLYATRRLQLPSPFACSGEREAFAELAAFLTVDGQAATYIPEYVRQYFNDDVFAMSAATPGVLPAPSRRRWSVQAAPPLLRGCPLHRAS